MEETGKTRARITLPGAEQNNVISSSSTKHSEFSTSLATTPPPVVTTTDGPPASWWHVSCLLVILLSLPYLYLVLQFRNTTFNLVVFSIVTLHPLIRTAFPSQYVPARAGHPDHPLLSHPFLSRFMATLGLSSILRMFYA